MQEMTKFQDNCIVALTSISFYRSKFSMEEFREDMGWTLQGGFVDHWVEEQFLSFKRNPFDWFFAIDDDSKAKFLAGVEKRIGG